MQRGEEGLQQLQVGLDLLAVTGTVEQFGLDDAAQRDLFGRVLLNLLLDVGGALVEDLDAKVGIKGTSVERLPFFERSLIGPFQLIALPGPDYSSSALSTPA